MLFECGNRTLGRIDSVVMGRDKVDVHAVGPDMGFDGLGTLIVYVIECWCISTCIQVGENVGECCNHGAIVSGWHCSYKDCIQIINICYKHVLHIPK